jgi:indolepyruvate ferredoxin oxidoreductase alpha subunit
MVYNKASATVIILDNRTTGMTGHQDHAATGKTLKGEPTHEIDLKELCLALGVPRVFVIDAFDTTTLEKTVKESAEGDTLTVIIAKAPCALLKGQKPKGHFSIDTDACRSCGACLKIGCPAISRDPEGRIRIDSASCNGCGLCVEYCKFGAIKKVEG